MELKTTEERNVSPNRVLDFAVGHGGNILPQRTGFQGYLAELTDTGIIFTNEPLKVEKEKCFIPRLQKPNSA